MSYCELYAIHEGKPAEALREYGNSHGFAPYVWAACCARLGLDHAAWLIEGAMPRLSELARDPASPRHLRLSLWMTFDGAVAEIKHAGAVASALRALREETRGAEYFRGHVCHLEAIADDVDALAARFWYPASREPTEPSIAGFGLYVTSVCEHPFYVRDECPHCHQDMPESRLYVHGKDDPGRLPLGMKWLGKRLEGI